MWMFSKKENMAHLFIQQVSTVHSLGWALFYVLDNVREQKIGIQVGDARQ